MGRASNGGGHWSFDARRTLLLVALGVGAVANAAAQAAPRTTPGAPDGTARGAVRGVVRDDAGRPLAGAQLHAVGASVSAESNESGAFRLNGLATGPSRIVVRRIGFAPETLRVTVAASAASESEVRLTRVAVPLDPVVVRGRREVRGPMAGFYARLEQGNGRFFTQEQIAKRNISQMSDLLRGIPGLRVQQRRSGVSQFRLRGSAIAPLVWLDGIPMGSGEVDLDAFDPRSFAGIEVYSGPATVPVQFSGSRTMTTSGGAIVLWTREGDAGPPRRRRGAPTPALLVARMIERGEAFTADGVDLPASIIEEELVPPLYPDSLLSARVPGSVEVEFVVDATGRVRMDTYGVISTTHRGLIEPVRRALHGQAFVPAIKGGRPVPQVVQLPFVFLPDSGVVVRKPKD